MLYLEARERRKTASHKKMNENQLLNCSGANPINLGVDSWAFASTTCSISNSTTTPALIYSITGGEAVIATFSFLLLAEILFFGFFNLITKKTSQKK